MAVTFASLAGFGDVRGTGVATEYMSVRSTDSHPGTNGWSTHAITPPQNPLTFNAAAQGLDPVWEGDFSSDLSAGAFRAWSPLTDVPDVADAENLYVRNDLRTPGAGVYQLASDCPFCAGTPLAPAQSVLQVPRFAGASADFGHVVYESTQPLVSGSTGDGFSVPNVYEWDHGTLRLAGILPDSACGSPPCVAPSSIAGQGSSGNFYTPHVVSTDGSRIFFTDNSATGDQTGALYVRVDGSTTAQINASERATPDPNGSPPATFWNASADGSRAFFTTREELTDDDTDPANDLYMYDAGAPVGHHLTRLSVDNNAGDPPNDVQGVIGASDDGRYVYFVAAGQLVAGQPVLSADVGIYEWHDGTVFYIGQMADPGRDTSQDLQTNWALGALGSRVSADGRHVVFVSHTGVGLTGYDHGDCGGVGCPELYVYSADSHELQCASCNPSGMPATAEASLNAAAGRGGSDNTSHLNRAISDDGRRIFFSTAEALVPQDTNGKIDAYEFDTVSNSVHLISSGTDPSDAYFMDASGNGDDVFFLTRARLVGWDTDQNYDLYDARVHGGFPDPVPVTPGCAGDACQGRQSLPPSAILAGSAFFSGTGNVKALPRSAKKPVKHKPVKCKRGLVRKRVKGKVRCVRQKRRAARATLHVISGQGRVR